MKSPFAKLKKFVCKNDAKDKRDSLPPSKLDELAQAAQDMQDMRNCYDSLLSAAAATANSAYEFSESLREMGACLLEKTILHDDEESGRVFVMLGKVQHELQKLVDSYRSHVIVTITNPSESLLNELRTVEDMKRQCDEKRLVYEYMMAQQKEKGRSKGGKCESVTPQQLQMAHDEYDEEATLCVFRLKSLKQGQARSLLTQATRHHAAQLNFFRKGLKSLEAVEPHIRLITERQHIDYQFSGLEDDGGADGEDVSGNDYDTSQEGELSFDYRPRKQRQSVSTSRNSVEVDEGLTFPLVRATENAEINLDKHHRDHQVVSTREPRAGSHSAPIFAEKQVHPAEKVRQMQPPYTRKSNTYVLPTPTDAQGVIPSRTSSSDPRTRPTYHTARTNNLWHSSPLEQKKHEKDYGDGQLSELTVLKANSVLKESNSNTVSTHLPPPLTEGLSLQQFETLNVSHVRKAKGQSFSGPLSSSPWSMKPAISASGPISSPEFSQLVSGVPSLVHINQPSSSPKLSPAASPPHVSSPRITELHELPRPPGNLNTKPVKSPGLIRHSAPLALRNQELSATNKNPSVALNNAAPLPAPPLIVSRSFSIPSSSQRSMALHVSKLLDSPQVLEKPEDVSSPPLTPISLANIKPVSTVYEGQNRGGS